MRECERLDSCTMPDACAWCSQYEPKFGNMSCACGFVTANFNHFVEHVNRHNKDRWGLDIISTRTLS